MKEIITVNAHSIINFIKCPRRFLLSSIYEPPRTTAMDRGILFAKFLEIYYKRKQKRTPTIISPFWKFVIAKRLQVSDEEAEVVWRAAYRYIKQYESCTWVPIAVESGFSRILHETSNYTFIVEGRPDLVARESTNNSIIVVDHKTQSAFRPIYEFNHQLFMYLYATGARNFCYNYIVIKKDPEFRRNLVTVSDGEIEYWKEMVIELLIELTRSKFLPNFNCVDQYGKCPFTDVCRQPSAKYQEWLLNTHFKRRDKRLRSW